VAQVTDECGAVAIESLRRIAVWGTDRLAKALSLMVGRPVGVLPPRVAFVPLRSISDIAGGPESAALGSYLSVSGDLTGHVILLIPVDSARALADLVMGNPAGTTTGLDEMALSALSEVANITGSSFLNAIADSANLVVLPSPPCLAMDMTAALLSSVLSGLYTESDEAIIIETRFIETEREARGFFFLALDADSLDRLVQVLRAGV
jgi:chemotaxis protein CheC